MCASLPHHPNFDDVKKEARKLLHDVQRGDAAALKRCYSVQSWDRMTETRLADAQYIIAREHGFASWKKLTEHLDSFSNSNC
jgi:hypothetical protein